MFDREMDFYGISADCSLVEHESVISAVKLARQQYDEADKHHDMMLNAYACYQEYYLKD